MKNSSFLKTHPVKQVETLFALVCNDAVNHFCG